MGVAATVALAAAAVAVAVAVRAALASPEEANGGTYATVASPIWRVLRGGGQGGAVGRAPREGRGGCQGDFHQNILIPGTSDGSSDCAQHNPSDLRWLDPCRRVPSRQVTKQNRPNLATDSFSLFLVFYRPLNGQRDAPGEMMHFSALQIGNERVDVVSGLDVRLHARQDASDPRHPPLELSQLGAEREPHKVVALGRQ